MAKRDPGLDERLDRIDRDLDRRPDQPSMAAVMLATVALLVIVVGLGYGCIRFAVWIGA